MENIETPHRRTQDEMSGDLRRYEYGQKGGDQKVLSEEEKDKNNRILVRLSMERLGLTDFLMAQNNFDLLVRILEGKVSPFKIREIINIGADAERVKVVGLPGPIQERRSGIPERNDFLRRDLKILREKLDQLGLLRDLLAGRFESVLVHQNTLMSQTGLSRDRFRYAFQALQVEVKQSRLKKD